jgi:anti-sigma-K factor RskA
VNIAPGNVDLVDRLAAEYVLGTLRGSARRRLERWRATSALVDERCRFWEEGLMPLLLGLKPVTPPPHIWQGIRARLNLSSLARRDRVRRYALAASVVLVALLGVLAYWRTLAPGRAVEVATISATSGALMWQVEIYAAAGEAQQLSIRAGTLAAPPAGRDYELWALPKGRPPVSLGLLPYRHSATRRVLSAAQQQALAASAQVAVSVEPPGGSPTGQPTGAVLFVAPLRNVS